jgi:methionyl aminopeptidase
MAIMIKSSQEIDKMRRSGQAVREILDYVRGLVRPGVTTMDLENAAAARMQEMGVKPAFKGYRGYPAVLCTSINSEVVHGIPSAERVLRDGDIVSVDTGVVIDGFYGDSATTVAVGEKVNPKTQKLLRVTEESLQRGIEAVKAGATLGDIGAAVQQAVEAEGFSVVREFVGHGIGTRLHEDPQVPNYGRRGQGQKLREGMVFCIEPMVNAGRPEVRVLDDGWTAVSEDGSLSAHFEHTIAVTPNGALVLTQ